MGNRRMRTRMYGGVGGRKTKVGRKLTFVFLLPDFCQKDVFYWIAWTFLMRKVTEVYVGQDGQYWIIREIKVNLSVLLEI